MSARATVDAAPTEPGCDYCGLPAPGARPADGAPQYCCFGCRFAAQVTRERGEEGAARWALTRVGIAVFFTMNVVMLSMALWSGDWYAGANRSGDPLSSSFADLLRWGSLFCSMPVLLLLGPGLAESGWEQIRRGLFSTDALLISGVAAAYAYSAVSVIRGDGQVYFEVGCVVLVTVTLGRWFEATGRLRASAALDALERLLPETVRRVESVGESVIPIADVRVGDRLRILAGERFPTDGRLVAHAASVDEQLLTGESWPVTRRPGETVFGGSLNLDGTALLDVTSEPAQGTLARLVALVRDARRSRGDWQRMTERVSGFLFPAIALVAIGATAWHWHRRGFEEGLLAGLAVSLIACPCALGLATPMAVWTALGAAAGRQVLFRSGEVLERLASVRTVCLDKTGTLTTGEPRLSRLLVDSETWRADVEREAGALAAGSSHVLSRAILKSIGSMAPASNAGVRVTPGRGLQAWSPALNGDVVLGSLEYLAETGHDLSSELQTEIDAVRFAGCSMAAIGWGGRVRGVFAFEEELRPEAAKAIARLRRLGCDVLVLTGDHAARGVRLSQELGVPVAAGLLPGAKLRHVEERKQRGGVAMVGDGINDAPSLAASDVGIAMGCGADVSRDSAGVCLLSNDLERLPWAIELARATVRTIRVNLFWAFGWNLIGVGLAATGHLNPAVAAFAMIASSVLVITNSLRLRSLVGDQAEDARLHRDAREGLAVPPSSHAPIDEPRALPLETAVTA